MNNINARNVVIIVAAVVIGLVVLGFIGTILSNIVPLAIVAAIAFILGRMSNRVDYLQLGRDAAKRMGDAAQSATGKSAERAETRQQAQGYDKTAQEANQRIAAEATTAAEQAAAKAEAKAAEPPARLAETEAKAVEPPARLAESEAPVEEDLSPTPKLDVKTVEQIQAEARLVEQEAAKKASTLDVQAALEERRKRLLSGKSDEE
jgi:hypothetical protein